MSKVILALTAGILGVGTGWVIRPTASEATPQQTLDSMWTKLAPGQGFGPWAVFSCAPEGALGVTLIRQAEAGGYTDSAETTWGTGEAIYFEDPEKVCDCSGPGFNELGPCRQGQWTPVVQKP